MYCTGPICVHSAIQRTQDRTGPCPKELAIWYFTQGSSWGKSGEFYSHQTQSGLEINLSFTYLSLEDVRMFLRKGFKTRIPICRGASCYITSCVDLTPHALLQFSRQCFKRSSSSWSKCPICHHALQELQCMSSLMSWSILSNWWFHRQRHLCLETKRSEAHQSL